jgi:hypothetical protein
MSTPTATLTGDQLEALTGLTDRRIRQLAKAGYFPPPKNGVYQQVATIRGLFKYYREDHHNTSRTLNDAKLEKLRADAEMSRIKVQQARRETIDRNEVADYLRAWTAKLDLLLTAELENNAPNLVLGRPIDEIRSEMRQMHDRIREATRRGLRAWEDDNPIHEYEPPADEHEEDDPEADEVS